MGKIAGGKSLASRAVKYGSQTAKVIMNLIKASGELNAVKDVATTTRDLLKTNSDQNKKSQDNENEEKNKTNDARKE